MEYRISKEVENKGNYRKNFRSKGQKDSARYLVDRDYSTRSARRTVSSHIIIWRFLPAPVRECVFRAILYLAIGFRLENYFYSIIKPGVRVLDFGCGGGEVLYTERARTVIGMDANREALGDANRIYSAVAQADGTSIPFKDSTFDVVIAANVWEHFRVEEQRQLAGEILRILRPGGILGMVSPVISRAPIIKNSEDYPAFFEEWFINEPGHFGLDTADAYIRLLRAAGFRLVNHSSFNHFFLWPIGFFGFLEHHPRPTVWFRLLRCWENMVAGCKPVKILIGLIYGVVDRWLAVLPLSGFALACGLTLKSTSIKSSHKS